MSAAPETTSGNAGDDVEVGTKGAKSKAGSTTWIIVVVVVLLLLLLMAVLAFIVIRRRQAPDAATSSGNIRATENPMYVGPGGEQQPRTACYETMTDQNARQGQGLYDVVSADADVVEVAAGGAIYTIAAEQVRAMLSRLSSTLTGRPFPFLQNERPPPSSAISVPCTFCCVLVWVGTIVGRLCLYGTIGR